MGPSRVVIASLLATLLLPAASALTLETEGLIVSASGPTPEGDWATVYAAADSDPLQEDVEERVEAAPVGESKTLFKVAKAPRLRANVEARVEQDLAVRLRLEALHLAIPLEMDPSTTTPKQDDAAPPADGSAHDHSPITPMEAPIQPAYVEAPEEPLSVAPAIAAGIAAGGIALPWLGGRRILGRLLLGGAFLFSRFSRDDVLDQPRRLELFEYVRQNPGETFENVRRALNLSHGVMSHHVRVLDQHDLVRAHRVGARTVLYPAGPRVEPRVPQPQLRRDLLAHAQANPGSSQRDIARAMSLSERSVSYHVARLQREGLVEVRRTGNVNRLFPRELTQVVQAPY